MSEEDAKRKNQKAKEPSKIDLVAMAFQEINALDIAHPCRLDALTIDPFIFKRQILHLINHNVIILVPETEDLYYFDIDNYIEYSNEMKKRIFIIIVYIVIHSVVL
ncbi:MAG: hypothetical protein FK734_10755, partial [Asgard group archaeon]|nr:hypothetical protein [Asgard group archaeon]